MEIHPTARAMVRWMVGAADWHYKEMYQKGSWKGYGQHGSFTDDRNRGRMYR